MAADYWHTMVAIMRIVFSLLLFSAACATTSTTPGPLRVHTDARPIASCIALGVIEERIESVSELDDPKAQVQQAVRERAAKLGASDLVITADESDATYAYARAEAYRCKR